MTWDTTMVIMLRTLINDLDSTEYTDTRLKKVIVVAAQFTTGEIDFDVDYTVNVATPDISPDPTTDPQDDGFINLTVLKAACIIDMGNMRIAAKIAGVEAKCGPAVIRTLKQMDGFKTLIEDGYCATYAHLRDEYNLGNVKYVKAVLSPFTSPDFDPEDYSVVLEDSRMYR